MPNPTLSIDVSGNKIRLSFDPIDDVQHYLSQFFANCNNCLDSCNRKATPTYTSHPWGRVWSKNRLEFWLPNNPEIITNEFISTAIHTIIAPLQLLDTTEDIPTYTIDKLRSREYVTAFTKADITAEQLLLCVQAFIGWTEQIRQEYSVSKPDSVNFLPTMARTSYQKGLGVFIGASSSGQESPLVTSRPQGTGGPHQ